MVFPRVVLTTIRTIPFGTISIHQDFDYTQRGTTFYCIISLLLSCISDSDQLIIGCAQILPKIIEHEIIFNLQHKFEVVFYP